MKNQYDLEQFAISLISLTLTRNNYLTQKNVRFDPELVADIVARKRNGVGVLETFVVVTRWLPSKEDVDKQLTEARADLEEKFGLPVFFACVIGEGKQLVVDASLNQKMLYSPKEITVTFLEPDNSAAVP